MLSSFEIKKISCEILEYITTLCEKNEIQYYLDFGTLLGAIRHEGFIPWDDDIDICMSRNEFNKFIHVMQKENNNRYKLLCLEVKKNYTLPLPKVIDTYTALSQVEQKEKEPLGVYVDIFILDNVPDKVCERKKFYKKFEFLQRCWRYAQYKYKPSNSFLKSLMRWILMKTCSVVGPRYFAVRINKLAQKYNEKKTMCWANLTYADNLEKETRTKVDYKESIIGYFENKKYAIPIGYDMILKQYYGDYMQLPPEENRVSVHNFIAEYKKKSICSEEI